MQSSTSISPAASSHTASVSDPDQANKSILRSTAAHPRWFKARHYILYGCFMLWGATSIIPFPIFTSAHSFFLFKLNSLSEEEYILKHDPTQMQPATNINSTETGTEGERLNAMQSLIEPLFIGTFAVVAIISSLVGMVLSRCHVTYFKRMFVGHVLIVLALVPNAILAKVDVRNHRVSFMIFVVSSNAVSTLGGIGFIAGTVIGMAAQHSKRAVQLVLIGHGVSHLVSAQASFIALLTTKGPGSMGLVYFTMGSLVTILSLVSYMWVNGDHPFACVAPIAVLDQQQAELAVVVSQHTAIEQDIPTSDDTISMSSNFSDSSSDMPKVETALCPAPASYNAMLQSNRMPLKERMKKVPSDLWVVLRLMKYELPLMLMANVLYVSIYPSVAVTVTTSYESVWWRKYFSPLAVFTVGSLGNMTGSAVSSLIQWPKEKSWNLWLMMLPRFALTIAILFCNIQDRTRTISWPVIKEDGLFCLLLFTHIAIGSHQLVILTDHATSQCEGKLKDMAGSVANGIGLVGVLIGCAINILWAHVLS